MKSTTISLCRGSYGSGYPVDAFEAAIRYIRSEISNPIRDCAAFSARACLQSPRPRGGNDLGTRRFLLEFPPLRPQRLRGACLERGRWHARSTRCSGDDFRCAIEKGPACDERSKPPPRLRGRDARRSAALCAAAKHALKVHGAAESPAMPQIRSTAASADPHHVPAQQIDPGIAPQTDGPRGPAAPQNPPPPPFVLSPQEQSDLDQVLDAWEQKNGQIKTFKCDFTRIAIRSGFLSKAARQPEEPRQTSKGEIKYVAPDKGLLRETEGETWSLNPTTRKLEKKKLEALEHWACDGKNLYKVDYQQKTVEEIPIPPELQGKGITQGPLPFVFGAKAADLKARYYIRPTTPKDDKDHAWLEIRPKFIRDAQNFSKVELILRTQRHVPHGDSDSWHERDGSRRLHARAARVQSDSQFRQRLQARPSASSTSKTTRNPRRPRRSAAAPPREPPLRRSGSFRTQVDGMPAAPFASRQARFQSARSLPAGHFQTAARRLRADRGFIRKIRINRESAGQIIRKIAPICGRFVLKSLSHPGLEVELCRPLGLLSV